MNFDKKNEIRRQNQTLERHFVVDVVFNCFYVMCVWKSCLTRRMSDIVDKGSDE